MKNRIVNFVKSQSVLVISFIAAVISMFFVPPDEKYVSYIDRSVLILLFCLMSAVAGLRSIGFFKKTASYLLNKTKSVRNLGFILINLCFFSSMLITNDVALITFVPLTIMLFEETNDKKSLIYTVITETVAANLGSMLTPIGNPQNLYIYSHYELSMGDFLKMMLPLGVIGYILLCGLTFILSSERLNVNNNEKVTVSKGYMIVYSLLFAVCLLTVLRIISDYVCLAVTLAVIFAANKRIFLEIDYMLLLTFVCFFVFVGNAGNIEVIRSLISSAVNGRELIVSALLSQVLSNVPAAVMLSGFTDNYADLLRGVDIGGLGTPIASLASLISYKLYVKSRIADSRKYMCCFLSINAVFLVLMIFAVMIWK